MEQTRVKLRTVADTLHNNCVPWGRSPNLCCVKGFCKLASSRSLNGGNHVVNKEFCVLPFVGLDSGLRSNYSSSLGAQESHKLNTDASIFLADYDKNGPESISCSER